jgi:hypothetical protein
MSDGLVFWLIPGFIQPAITATGNVSISIVVREHLQVDDRECDKIQEASCRKDEISSFYSVYHLQDLVVLFIIADR